MSGEAGAVEDSWPNARRLEAAVLDAADRLRAARRRGRTPNRIDLIDTLNGLFEALAHGQRLFMVNKVAKSFSEVAIDGVPPRPEQVLASWELAYRDKDDLDALRKHVERRTNGTDMAERAKAWQTARKRAEESQGKVSGASVDNPKLLISLAEEAGRRAARQAEALGGLVDLISPEDEAFELGRDYVADLAVATQQPKAERDNRRRGLRPNGPRVRKERTSRKWSRAKLVEEIEAATGVGLSDRTVARVENGEGSDRRTLDAIAKTLNLTLDEIVVA